MSRIQEEKHARQAITGYTMNPDFSRVLFNYGLMPNHDDDTVNTDLTKAFANLAFE